MPIDLPCFEIAGLVPLCTLGHLKIFLSACNNIVFKLLSKVLSEFCFCWDLLGKKHRNNCWNCETHSILEVLLICFLLVMFWQKIFSSRKTRVTQKILWQLRSLEKLAFKWRLSKDVAGATLMVTNKRQKKKNATPFIWGSWILWSWNCSEQ